MEILCIGLFYFFPSAADVTRTFTRIRLLVVVKFFSSSLGLHHLQLKVSREVDSMSLERLDRYLCMSLIQKRQRLRDSDIIPVSIGVCEFDISYNIE